MYDSDFIDVDEAEERNRANLAQEIEENKDG